MSSNSGGTDNEMEWETNEKVKKRKRKGKENPGKNAKLTQQEINEIIGSTKNPTTSKNLSVEINSSTSDIPKNTSQISNINKNPSTNNYSQQMNKILNQDYKNLYYITTTRDFTRIQIADFWSLRNPQSKDVILKTSKGFLLKTNLEKGPVINCLNSLKQSQIIKDFEETNSNRQPSNKTFKATFACVISTVEHDIEDTKIKEHLEAHNIELRYCKRITSRATGKLTQLIRIITGDFTSFQKLLNEGVFYKNRHYPVYPSSPPAPTPAPCAKCSLFTHTTEQCKAPLTCRKCQGRHHTNSCTSPLPEKCNACNAEDHQAWSIKCPKRPVKPIEGIPNARIKTMNKKSHEIDQNITKKQDTCCNDIS